METIGNYYNMKRKVLINLIAGGMQLVNVIVLSSLMKFFTDVIGMSPALYGSVFLVFMIWNGVNDPIIGYWADKRPFLPKLGKYGRLVRWSVPVMAFSIIPLFFTSPEWSEVVMSIYLLLLLVLYEGGRTMLDVSFNAFKINTFLSMKDRTEMQVIGSYVSMLPALLGSMIPVWFLAGDFSRMTLILVFSGTIAFGLIITYIGSLYIKEDPEFYRHMVMSKSIGELFKVFLELIKDRIFLFFVLGFFFIQAATGNYYAGYLYYMDNVVLADSLQATIPDILTGVFQMMMYPLIVISVKKYGSRTTLVLGLLMSVIGFATLALPVNYWVAAAMYIIVLGGMAFNGSVMQPLQGLVVDNMEIKTGKRQPGVIAGIIAVFLIPASSIQPFILSMMMEATGYIGDVKEQTAEVVTAIRMGTGLVPAVMLIIGIIVISRIPIDFAREKEIQQIMEAKHGKGETDELSEDVTA